MFITITTTEEKIMRAILNAVEYGEPVYFYNGRQTRFSRGDYEIVFVNCGDKFTVVPINGKTIDVKAYGLLWYLEMWGLDYEVESDSPQFGEIACNGFFKQFSEPEEMFREMWTMRDQNFNAAIY